MIRLYFSLAIFCFLSTTSKGLLAQKQSIFQTIHDQETVPTIVIHTDFKQLVKKKMDEEYQEGTLHLEINDEKLDFPIRIKTRGNMRKRVCKNPPFKIDFDKKELKEKGFKGLDKLKAVIPCKNSGSFAERNKMEHFLYELYSVIEPAHLLSVIVNFEFWTDGELKESMTGFLVEEEEHYAKRSDAVIVTQGSLRPGGLQRSNFLNLCFFQYMIANTDWSISNKHNIEFVKFPDVKRVVPLAYDFDYAGIINQPYAVPHESLPIEHVTERHAYKTLIKEGEAVATAKHFMDKKSEFLAVCDEATYLEEKTRNSIKKFIEKFYKEIKTDKKVIKIFAKN